MTWILTILFSIALVELLVALPLLGPLASFKRFTGRSIRVMRAEGVSDHWKEKAMGGYARRTFKASMTLTGILLVFAAGAGALAMVFNLISDGFLGFILTVPGILASTLAAGIYFAIRSRLRNG